MKKNNETDYRFLLFIAPGQKNSINAERNINRFLEKYLKDQFELRIVDVTKDPKIALDKGVYFTPMLILTFPVPEVYLVGDLSDEAQIKKAILD